MIFDEKTLSVIFNELKKAGEIAMKLREKGLIVEKKEDGSYVTNADKELDILLTKMIKNKLKNNDMIISEEDVALGNHYDGVNKSFWSIDPIDSTSSFINNVNDYWSINIAYIKNNQPIFGLIYAPQQDKYWYGDTTKMEAFKIDKGVKSRIFVREISSTGATLISPEEQTSDKDIIDKLNIREEIKIPSAIKFCYIAEGFADYYYRKRNKACDWDISCGHSLIVAAGGSVNFLIPDEDFKYGQYPYKAPNLLATGKVN